MRIAGTSIGGEALRRPLVSLGTLILGAFGACELAQYDISGDSNGVADGGLYLAGLAIVILKNWRDGIYFFLRWRLFPG